MALEGTTLVYVALAGAAVAAILMVGLTRKPKDGANATLAGEVPAATDGPNPAEDLLLKYVVNAEGQRQGETVALEGEKVVMKTPDGFLLVPQAQLTREGANVRLVEPLDWEAAKREGEAWREKSHKVITYTPDEIPPEQA